MLQSRDAWDVVNYFSMPPADAGFAAPVVDGEAGLPDPFLPASTEQIFADGQFNKDVQVMVGKSVFIYSSSHYLQFDGLAEARLCILKTYMFRYCEG